MKFEIAGLAIVLLVLVGFLLSTRPAPPELSSAPYAPPETYSPPREKCLPYTVDQLRSATAFELKAVGWRRAPDLGFLGTTGYVTTAHTGFIESHIVYDISGPAVDCVEGATLYATIEAPGDAAETKRKFVATMERVFVNLGLKKPAGLDEAIASRKVFAGSTGDVSVRFDWERFPNGAKQLDGSEYKPQRYKLDLAAAKERTAGAAEERREVR